MKFLLIPMGTPGDVQPFIDLALALQSRGREVQLIAHANFRGWVEQYGVPFVELGPAEQYQRLLADKNLWTIHKSPRVFAKKLVLPTLHPLYEIIRAAHADSGAVVVAQTMALGARVARDKLDMPLITIHRQPAVMRSLYDSPHVPYFAFGRFVPRPIKRLEYRLIDASLDHTYGPKLNAFRAELGLPPVRQIVGQWLHSPDRVLGFWPEWFAPMQPDWPANMRLVGFDVQTRGEQDPPQALVEFMQQGEPPILFTVGSGMQHGRAFYEASARACELLGRRGLLVTRKADQIPPKRPPSVMHVEYAPFNWLLPQCAAVVHHAGIGTIAQSLAAGIPQLSMPGVVFDTPDNAIRLKRLGAGQIITQKRYTPERVAAMLRRLLDDPAVTARARELADKVRSIDAIALAATEIEHTAFRGRDAWSTPQIKHQP